MAHKGKISMLSLFQLTPITNLKFLTPVEQLQDILLSQPLKPQNSNNDEIDPNSCLVNKHQEFRKKSNQAQGIQGGFKKEAGKHDEKKHEEKQKVYKKGPFAEFYENNEEVFDKDVEAWYYKEGKQIIGPVSSYNMDKMVYHKTITGQTRVAFKTIEKFVKFSKIQKALEEAKGEQHEEHEDTTHGSEHSHQQHHGTGKDKSEQGSPKKQHPKESPKTKTSVTPTQPLPPL